MNDLSPFYIQDCEKLPDGKAFARKSALDIIGNHGESIRLKDTLFSDDFNPRKGKAKDWYCNAKWFHPSEYMFRWQGLIVEPL